MRGQVFSTIAVVLLLAIAILKSLAVAHWAAVAPLLVTVAVLALVFFQILRTS